MLSGPSKTRPAFTSSFAESSTKPKMFLPPRSSAAQQSEGRTEFKFLLPQACMDAAECHDFSVEYHDLGNIGGFWTPTQFHECIMILSQ